MNRENEIAALEFFLDSLADVVEDVYSMGDKQSALHTHTATASTVSIVSSFFATAEEEGDESAMAAEKSTLLVQLRNKCDSILRGDSGSVTRFGWKDDIACHPHTGMIFGALVIQHWKDVIPNVFVTESKYPGNDIELHSLFFHSLLFPCTQPCSSPKENARLCDRDLSFWSFSLARLICLDFPLDVWSRVLVISRAAAAVAARSAEASVLSRRYGLSLETLLLRSLHLMTMSLAGVLEHHCSEREDNAEESCPRGLVVPADALQEIRSIRMEPLLSSVVDEVECDHEVKSSSISILVSAIFSDLLWLWAYTPNFSTLSWFHTY